ncbi:GNAT family N-acetyltransferase [Kurthia sibirica]|uniref:GNAT family N-acetyltransferase n=1 Tax=Kurthia sibirica TaxID=202750 RepID=A0A2U3AMW1_9BACL|nr:GNAT family N-acetyltransferase [Kurthia sibirica]PWI25862.1 GNAT family N-acetyltransferase [Kurthia sibirica]GEK34299.1 N-acetyltransferase [Kurthia sibirica]
MANIRVKLVQNEQELEDAFSVRQEVFVKEQGIPAPLEQDVFDAVSQHIVAYCDDQPIAAGRVRIVDDHVAKVDRVCVLPAYRRKQVGVRMMEKLEHYVKDYHIDVIKIHAQTHAVPFYETQDYKVTSPEFIDGGAPFRAMEKKMTND